MTRKIRTVTIRGLAEQEGKSPSTVLRRVRGLEAEWGVTLLVPSRDHGNGLEVDAEALKRLCSGTIRRRTPPKEESVRQLVLLL